MKCSQCGEPLPFVPCISCKGEVPEKSRYCCWCGAPISTEEGEIDFSQRKLCSDGTCIGAIDEEGICNICKRSFDAELR
jgi:hypothetical protein